MAGDQTYTNHARVVPLYHYVTFPIVTINFGWQLSRLSDGVSAGVVIDVLTAAAIVLMAFYLRAFALRAQDRVIRLEMQIRLRERIPAELHPRIDDLTIDQLVALRFAGDDELAALTTRVLDEGIRDRKSIKKLVANWKADDLRV